MSDEAQEWSCIDETHVERIWARDLVVSKNAVVKVWGLGGTAKENPPTPSKGKTTKAKPKAKDAAATQRTSLSNMVRRSLKAFSSRGNMNGARARDSGARLLGSMLGVQAEFERKEFEGAAVIDMHGTDDHAVFVLSDGSVFDVTDNEQPDSFKRLELDVAPKEVAVSAKCGDVHSAVLTNQGRVMVVGSDGGAMVTLTVPRNERIVQIACTRSATLMLGRTGRLFVHGAGDQGELGLGESEKAVKGATARQVLGPFKHVPLTSISASATHCLAVVAGGRVFGWGSNAAGQISKKAKASVFWPEAIQDLEPSFEAAQAVAGPGISAFVSRHGALAVIGGGGLTGLHPFFHSKALTVDQVALGEGNCVVLTDEGEVFAADLGGAKTVDELAEARLVDRLSGDLVFRLGVAGSFGYSYAHPKANAPDARELRKLSRGRLGAPPTLRISGPALFSESQHVLDRPNDEDASEELESKVLRLLTDPYVLGASMLLDLREGAAPSPSGNGGARGSQLDLEWAPRAIKTAIKAVRGSSAARAKRAADKDGLQSAEHAASFHGRLSRGVEGIIQAMESWVTSARLEEHLRLYLLVMCTPIPRLALGAFARLASALERLHESMRSRLFQWVNFEVDGTAMRNYVVPPLVHALEVHILSDGVDSEPGPEAHAVANTLHKLFKINERRAARAILRDGTFSAIPAATFATGALLRTMTKFGMVSYIHRWTEPQSLRNKRFHLFDFPEVISADTKAVVVQLESEEIKYRRFVNARLNQERGGARPAQADGADAHETAFFVIEVRRDHLKADALDALIRAAPVDLCMPLLVKFAGEKGVDAGGVKKEFFHLLSSELFDPDAPDGAFRRDPSSGRLWFRSPPPADSIALGVMCSSCRLVGQVIGLALFNSTILDVSFPLTLYRILLGLLDVKGGNALALMSEFDPSMLPGLRATLEYDGADFENDLGLAFEAAGPDGAMCDLVPGGADIPVTKENRDDYVERYVRFKLFESCKPLIASLLSGFQTVIDPNFATVALFRPDELELALIGSPLLDVDEFASSTKYEGGYHANHRVVKNFWEIVRAWPDERRRDLLRFATGAPRPPIGGIAALNFVIQRAGPNSENLPTASTCFNVLLLPEYDTKEKLEKKLEEAIDLTEGFGLM